MALPDLSLPQPAALLVRGLPSRAHRGAVMLLVPTLLAPSPIDGHGLFARARILSGTPIWRFMGAFDRLWTPDQAAQLDPEFLERYCQECPQTGFWVLCVDNARMINHSDDPNMACKAPLWDSRVTHDAIRDIADGEEITCDYRIGDAQPFSGFCTSEAA